MNQVGKNIRRLRMEKGIKQEEMADALHVTRQAISNWENGKTEPDIDTLTRIADYFGCSVEVLIYGKEKKSTTVKYVTRNVNVGSGSKAGIGFGAVLAMIISYVKWHSIGWAVLHGIFNWFYVVYFIIKYGWNG